MKDFIERIGSSVQVSFAVKEVYLLWIWRQAVAFVGEILLFEIPGWKAGKWIWNSHHCQAKGGALKSIFLLVWDCFPFHPLAQLLGFPFYPLGLLQILFCLALTSHPELSFSKSFRSSQKTILRIQTALYTSKKGRSYLIQNVLRTSFHWTTQTAALELTLILYMYQSQA